MMIQFRSILISIFWLLIFYNEATAQSQFNNQISFATLLNISPSSESRAGPVSIFNSFAAEYSRTFKPVVVNLTYSQWNNRVFNTNYNFAGVHLGEDTSEWVGSLWFRYNYRFFDMSALYKFEIKKIAISGGAGPSVTWGINSYVSGFFYSVGGIPDYVFWTDAKKDTKLGLVAVINAQYSFLHDRISAGLICKKRWYPHYFSQFELGLQAGVNF